MSQKTFDPKKFTVSFFFTPIDGWASGTMIKVTYNSDSWVDEAGATGEVSRAKVNDRRADVEISLLNSSASNDVLSGFHLADLSANSGTGPLVIADLNGTTVASATNAWIKKSPDFEAGNEVKTQTWVIRCAELDMFVGGL